MPGGTMKAWLAIQSEKTANCIAGAAVKTWKQLGFWDLLLYNQISVQNLQSGTAEYIQGKQGSLILGINLNSGCRNFNVKKTYYNYMEI